MEKKYILLEGLTGKGSGVASLAADSVTVSTNHCQGRFEIWLIASDNPEKRRKIGEIKGGGAAKFAAENALATDTVLLTEHKKPYLAGTLARKMPRFEAESAAGEASQVPTLLQDARFSWKKITDGSYPEATPIVRHIFNNMTTIRRVGKHRTYYYGTNGQQCAVAIPSAPDETNPFPHIAGCARYVDGFWVVCADKERQHYYSYE